MVRKLAWVAAWRPGASVDGGPVRQVLVLSSLSMFRGSVERSLREDPQLRDVARHESVTIVPVAIEVLED